jgi:hypothetical protein
MLATTPAARWRHPVLPEPRSLARRRASNSDFADDLDRMVDGVGAPTALAAARFSCEYSFGGKYSAV